MDLLEEKLIYIELKFAIKNLSVDFTVLWLFDSKKSISLT